MLIRRIKIKFVVTSLFFLLISPLIYAQEKIILAVSLVRHGDRAPANEIKNPKFTYQWPGGSGELTPLGMHQQYLLGQQMRERYIDQLHLLPPIYLNNSMYVLSTPLNRTIISGESFLSGLYPPGTGPKLSNGNPALPHAVQPIPIHDIPFGQPNLIFPGLADDLKQYRSLVHQYVFTQPTWKAANAKLTKDFQRWSKIFGVEIKNLNDLIVFGDYLYCMQVHGVPLPVGLTTEDRDKIIKLSMHAMALQFAPKEMATYAATPFLTKLNADLQLVAEGKQPYKYLLYFGHDVSILGIMSALGSPLESNPPYASYLSFELYQDGANFRVKVWYNGKPVSLTSNKSQTSYTLKEFLNVLKPYQRRS